jgi:Na+/H+ antiporter NhaA
MKIIAVAGIDDAVSVAGFGIIISLMFSTGGLAFQISQGIANYFLLLKLNSIKIDNLILYFSSCLHSWWPCIWNFLW